MSRFARSELIDVEVEVRLVTHQAILVSDGSDRAPVWLPLSQVEVERLPKGRAVITLPAQLATEKGLT